MKLFSTALPLLSLASSLPYSSAYQSGRHLTKSKSKKEKGGSDGSCSAVLEPPLPGIFPGVERPKIILAQDIDYPPYAILGPLEEDSPVSGFGADFAYALTSVCDIDMYVVQTQWDRCWGNDRIGGGLSSGEFHGCSTYTHPAGVRNRYLDFTAPILDNNRPAGILTRLDANGDPVVDGNSNLNGVKVIEIIGWAPTNDNLAIVQNLCTGQPFSGYEFVPPSTTTDQANDDALRALLDGEGDAIWIYADQAESYQCANNVQPTAWDCALWDQLGDTFAYVQTGIKGWAHAGTTLAISKKGSGLGSILDPCIHSLLKTETYYDLCQEYGLVDECFVNDFFPPANNATSIPDIPTNELTTECSEGYCSCPV